MAFELWLPEDTLRDIRKRAQAPGEEGAIYSAALESLLQEAGIGMADFELARDDAGWLKLGLGDSTGIPEQTRTLSVKRARAYFARDPLSAQAVRTWTNFTLGRGITFQAKDEHANDILREFWDAPINEPILSNKGQRKSNDKLLIDGEIFFIFFEAAGKVKIRRIDPLEIIEIITDPNDAETKKLYKRVWVDSQNKTHEAYYLDWANTNKEETWLDSLGTPQGTNADGVIYHVPFNSLSIRGVSLLFSGMDWAKAHRKFLEARASITQAMARFAWKAKIKGSAAQVAAVRSEWQSTLATTGSGETNPPPAPASTFVENEGYDLTPIKTETGAAAAQVDANMLLGIFGASVGILPHYFGAGEAFRLATAKAMELPMLVQFEAHQQFWADVYDNIFTYVMTKNKVDTDEQFVDIDFPPIVESEMAGRIEAITKAVVAFPELDGNDMRKLVLTTLGVNNPDEVLAGIAPVEVAAVKITKGLKELTKQLKEGNNGHKDEVPTL